MFKVADVDRDGALNRAEFGRVAESLGHGSEYVMFHWLGDAAVDELFLKYAGDDGQISYRSFQAFAEDGMLLKGRLSEYLSLFESCPSFEPEPGGAYGGFGTIDTSCVGRLGERLEHPLTAEEAAKALDSFCDGRECSVPERRIGFADFLNMFREHLLDLHQITEYMKLQSLPEPQFSPSDVEDAEAHAPRHENGIRVIESSEQFDALLTLHPDREVVLLAGLSWCRPCKGLTRPLEKLSQHYGDGAVFAKVMGDHNDSTKRLFKNRLKVRATPHITVHTKGVQAHMRTGANKSKLEDAVRRFYNTQKFKLPKKVLYPALSVPAVH